MLPPSGQTVTLTENTTIYTELYCSPEQHHEFHKVQPPSDVYSFGCILHDLVGNSQRIPYAKHSAPGKVGIIIEKCTDRTPKKRPTIAKLRDIVLEALIEAGGHFKVEDEQSEKWIEKLDTINQWKEEEFEKFIRFFMSLEHDARNDGFQSGYVSALSTPFLTRLTAEALDAIAKRQDGLSEAIIEKYCDWVRETSFSFGFADTICNRLVAIFDGGTSADKAIAFAALVELGATHNRWYVMRRALLRCGKDIPEDLAKRLAIQIRTEELELEFRCCVSVVNWDKNTLSSELSKLCEIMRA